MSKIKILTVDDQYHVRRLLEMLLESAGFEVKMATNGEQGLEMASSFRPDLIICDYKMPGRLNGIEMICPLRNEEFGEEIPIILLSGTASAALGVREHIEMLKKVIHVSKPFNLKELVALVQEMIEENRQRVES